MSAPEQPPAAAPEGNPPAAPQDPAPTPDPDGSESLGEPGKRALDRMKADLQAEKAERARITAELQTIKDRDLSDLQRAQKAASEAVAQLAEVQRQNVLLSKGIPADLTPPAATASPDDWGAYADRLVAWRGAPPVAPASGPRPDAGQGPRPDNKHLDDEAEYQEFVNQMGSGPRRARTN